VTQPAQWKIRAPFRARRWLRGGHVQTIASFLLPRKIHLPAPEERLVEVAPGIKVRCWCYWQRAKKEDRTQPLTLIVVHGLEGSSDSQYMRGVARDGLAAGMNVVLMNQRNCGGMDHFAPTLYNSSLSGDVAAVARHIVDHDGVSRFALIGFSMGGNLVLKLAGEWGSAGDGNKDGEGDTKRDTSTGINSQAPPQFRAVAAVCPSIDLAASADALHEPRNRIYEYYFLMQLFRRFRLKARLFPGKFDVSRLRGISTLRQFDDRITAYYCGFTGAGDYYARAAAANVIDRIAVPAFIIHSATDPFIRLTPETLRRIAANPNITYVEANDGGHCAFIGERKMGEPNLGGSNLGSGNGHAPDDGRWAEREVVEFMASQRT
jgi:predicted alpha/beta-fold hydrolase